MSADGPTTSLDPGDAIPIRVGIALVRRGTAYLIRRRPPLPGSPMPGVWEFPGGKCEGEETPLDAACREGREETGIEIRAVGLRRRLVHRYPHGLIELHYYDCEPIDDAAEPAACSGFAWVEGAVLPTLTFPEANGPLLDELAELAGPSST